MRGEIFRCGGKSHSDSYIGHFMLDQMKMELDFEQVKKFEAGFTNESAFFLEKHDYRCGLSL